MPNVGRERSVSGTPLNRRGFFERVAGGTYGVCVHCGIDIPAERLEFRPFAAGCVACQSSAR